MSYTMKKLPNLPTVVITYKGDVTVDEMKQADYELAMLIATHRGEFIYTIEDVREGKTTFVDLMMFVRDVRYAEDSEGLPVERRMITVGTNPMQNLSEQLRKFAGTIPNFHTVEEAIDHIMMDMMEE